MLNKRPAYVDTINNSGRTQRLYDPQLPNGFLDFAPGQVQPLPTPVFLRRLRTSWLSRAPVAPAAIEEPVYAEAEDLSDLSMVELRERARGLGLTIPVGTTKKAAAEMIGSAAKEAQNESQ